MSCVTSNALTHATTEAITYAITDVIAGAMTCTVYQRPMTGAITGAVSYAITDAHPGNSCALVRIQRAANGRARNEVHARGYGGLEEHDVQVAPRDGGAGEIVRIITGHARAEGSGDQHPFDRNRALADATADSQPIEHGERAGIERVAAELVSRKARAIDEAHIDTGPRQDERRHAAGRPRTDNKNV